MQTSEPLIRISVPEQRLDLYRAATAMSWLVIRSRLPVSAWVPRRAAGRLRSGDSRLAKRSAADLPVGTRFSADAFRLRPDDPPPATEDLIISRILWLDGLEEHNANTRERYIYIHGTNHEDEIGQPASHGCIRMRNDDLVRSFDQVPLGAEVVIET